MNLHYSYYCYKITMKIKLIPSLFISINRHKYYTKRLLFLNQPHFYLALNMHTNFSKTMFNITKRYKSSNQRIPKQFTSTPITESAIDDADDSTYETEDKGSKIMNISVSSLRIDLMLKTGLRMSRNKIETAFYEKRIQKNGFMIIKKSENVIIGDEIDLIANKPMVNPNFLTVSRITIADINFQHDEYKIKIVCEKNLIVENVSKNK
ncbi:uncharacterized protein LOC100499182 [Nasonia vitripennis]|uniref:Mitochondrial transcription rescue factor 1 C-terminal domain-containing protein n=2 Tax=Nasonia vitripennis TaxID=7425 RepID=A0A7M6USN2_NASVI|nr:uncharacterized protein LOC100499182 [Nasonia vitripennis]